MRPIFLALTFDSTAESRIRSLMSHIEAAGISTAHRTSNFDGHLRPHLTVGGYDVDRPEDWDESLEKLASQRRPFPVLLHALGVFVEAGVIYLAPRISGQLIEVRDAVLTLFERRNVLPRSSNLQRDRFNPHCALVPRSTGQQTSRAIDVCRKHWEPIDAIATGIGMIVPPQLVDRVRYRFNEAE